MLAQSGAETITAGSGGRALDAHRAPDVHYKRWADVEAASRTTDATALGKRVLNSSDYASPTISEPGDRRIPIVQPEVEHSRVRRMNTKSTELGRFRLRDDRSSKHHADDSQRHGRDNHPEHHGPD
jgi:hypothetical protein